MSLVRPAFCFLLLLMAIGYDPDKSGLPPILTPPTAPRGCVCLAPILQLRTMAGAAA